MGEYSTFSTERLKTMLEQGKYYNDKQLQVLVEELQGRGLLTEFQKNAELERIQKEKIVLREENEEGLLNAQLNKSKDTTSSKGWKYFSSIMLVLAVVISIFLYVKYQIIAWYIPAAGFATLKGSNF